MEPAVIDAKYKVVRLLGQGGMGAVYEARNLKTGRRVAVKVILGNVAKAPGLLERFEREARATGEVETQHIAHVIDTGTDGPGGNPYLVMEYLEGEDLHALLERTGPLPVDCALRITAQACVGLARAHAAGIIHRDIKPANLFLAKRDAGEITVKLLDFGIAKVTSGEPADDTRGLTHTGAVIGSPLYMSPEQLRGERQIDHRADLWSLGIASYQMLTGATPHGHVRGIHGLALAICSAAPKPVRELAPHVPEAVSDLVREALALDPQDRTESAEVMLEALRGLLPDGWHLNESMLTSLPAEDRRRLAEAAARPAAQTPEPLAAADAAIPTDEYLKRAARGGRAPSGEISPAPSTSEENPVAPVTGPSRSAAGSTTAGFTQSAGAPSPSPKAPRPGAKLFTRLAIAIGGLGGVAGALYLVAGRLTGPTDANLAEPSATLVVTSAPSQVAPSASAKPSFEATMRHAREGRDRAEAMRSPRYEGDGSSANIQSFVKKGTFLSWIRMRAVAVDTTVQDYWAAMDAAPTMAENVDARSEIAAMWASYAREFLAAPMPDGEAAKLLRPAIEQAARPVREKALGAARDCDSFAQGNAVWTPAAQRCAELLADLTEPSTSKPMRTVAPKKTKGEK